MNGVLLTLFVWFPFTDVVETVSVSYENSSSTVKRSSVSAVRNVLLTVYWIVRNNTSSLLVVSGLTCTRRPTLVGRCNLGTPCGGSLSMSHRTTFRYVVVIGLAN
jgi:hypothetical protein